MNSKDKVINFNEKLKENTKDLKKESKEDILNKFKKSLKEKDINKFKKVSKMLDTESNLLEFKIGIKGDKTLEVKSLKDQDFNIEDVVLATSTLDVNNFVQIVNRGIVLNQSPESILEFFGYLEEYRLSIINASIVNFLNKNAQLNVNPIYSQILNILEKTAMENKTIMEEKDNNSGIIIPNK